MGGFEVVIKEATEKASLVTDRGGSELIIETEATKNKTEFRKTLTPFGVIVLETLGMLPELNIEEIKDKGKANMLSKVLACVQALWMVVQVIGRKVNGLPVTLLELNTTMHVASVLGMYVLWFNKPQDVGRPTEIPICDDTEGWVISLLLRANKIKESANKIKESEKTIEDVSAYPCLKYEESMNAFTYQSQKGVPAKPIWTNTSKKTTATNATSGTNNLGTDVHSETSPDTDARASEATAYEVASICILRADPAKMIVISFRDSMVTDLKDMTLLNFTPDTRGISLPSLTQEQAWFLADYVCDRNMIRNVSLSKLREHCQFKGVGCDDYARNLTHGLFEQFNALQRGWLYMGPLIASSVIYGGIHLIPWNGHFPTQLERHLWRVACCEVIVAIPVFHLTKKSFVGFFNKWDSRWVKYAFIFVGAVIMAQYMIAARIFIFVETFASLRNSPVGSYDTVQWAEKWPHF